MLNPKSQRSLVLSFLVFIILLITNLVSWGDSHVVTIANKTDKPVRLENVKITSIIRSQPSSWVEPTDTLKEWPVYGGMATNANAWIAVGKNNDNFIEITFNFDPNVTGTFEGKDAKVTVKRAASQDEGAHITKYFWDVNVTKK